ncbi:MAG: CDP-glycerol glycerophosphotransferase family protein, partial [Treponema sp.]|nr:CDP-glycerol glycerophosphotransferase family protein [Treponema sp.]
LRALSVKLKFLLTGGRVKKADTERIPFVIYSDHKRYWNVFKPVCDEAERRGVDMRYYTQSPDDPVLEAQYKHIRAEFIGEGNRGFARLNFLKADVVLATTPGLGVYQWKRSRDVGCYVHILHSIDSPVRYHTFGLVNYDVLLLNGTHQEKIVRLCEEAQKAPRKELAITGLTYMDSLLERKNTLPPVHNDVPVVLLAPTWGKSSLLALYGAELLDALLATGYRIVIRPHPQSYSSEPELLEKLKEQYKSEPRVSWNTDNDNTRILNEADIMLSDISGVVFDLAFVFDKPFLYAHADWDPTPYDAAWVDEPLWSFTVLPELGREIRREDFPRLKEIIDEAIRSPSMSGRRAEIRNEAWQFQGQGGKATLDYLVKKQAEIETARKQEV